MILLYAAKRSASNFAQHRDLSGNRGQFGNLSTPRHSGHLRGPGPCAPRYHEAGQAASLTSNPRAWTLVGSSSHCLYGTPPEKRPGAITRPMEVAQTWTVPGRSCLPVNGVYVNFSHPLPAQRPHTTAAPSRSAIPTYSPVPLHERHSISTNAAGLVDSPWYMIAPGSERRGLKRAYATNS